MKLLAVAALLLAWPALWPQDAPPADGQAPDQSVVTLRQEVRNVVVDVVAMDKHGQPVRSLDKGHFQVFENGVAENISFFEEHSADNAAGATPTAKPTPQLPPNVYTNVQTAPEGGSLTVLLLDGLNTPFQNQSYVRGQMMDYLKQLPPGTHMAIFTLSDRLRLVQGFTANPAVLKAALDGKSYPDIPTLIPGALSGSTTNSDGLRLGGVAVPFASSVAMTRSSLNRFANETGSFDNELRIRYTLDALNALAVYLDGIPGRKNLVWFCSSIPWTINPDFSLVTGVTGRVDYSKDLKMLGNAMTLARVAVYPIDASGLVTPPGYGADNPGSGFGGRGNGGTFGAQEMNAQMNLAGNHMSMSNLAAATGGQAIYNTNGLAGAVGKVQAMGENYYTIAYSPKDKKYDGGFRELMVKVDEPGLKLEYRHGYYAEDPAKTAGRSLLVSSNPLRAVMQRGAPDATQLSFQVQVKAADRQPDPTRVTDRMGKDGASLTGPVVRYDFHWTLDLTGVEFITEANGAKTGEVDATLTAYDGDGKVLNEIYSVLPLRLSAASYDRLVKSGLPMKQSLDLPAGMVYLRAGVLDHNTGHTGATEFPLAVQAPNRGGTRANAAAGRM
jgi:VWFA-related protein